MTYFAFVGEDRAGTSELRRSLRPEHQTHFYTSQHDCVPIAGGPLLDSRQQAMIGSLLVVEARDLDAAQRFFARDPYALGNLFEHAKVIPWQWGFGRPERGEWPAPRF